MSLSETGKIAREFCKKHPKVSTWRLAHMIKEEYPGISLESARSAVRYHRGLRHGNGEAKSPIPFDIRIPQGIVQEWTDVTIPLSESPYLIIGDLHIPYHSKQAVEIALEYAYKRGIKNIILNGDIQDAYPISHYPKKKTNFAGMAQEREQVRQFLRELRRFFTGTIIFKAGNHEERVPKFYADNFASLVQSPYYDYIHSLDVSAGEHFLEKLNITYVQSGALRYGRLSVIHGSECGKSMGSAHPARLMFNKMLSCCISSHFHRTSLHAEPTSEGNLISCWTVGCLCQMHPEFAEINKWNHGLAVLYTEPNNWFRVENQRIVKNKIV
jgi:predicted phosphodiesterase